MPVSTAILNEPAMELSAAYRPLQYNVFVSGDYTEYPAAIEVAVLINGTQFGERIPVGHFFFDNSLITAAISLFRFSISERVQEFFDMLGFWPDVGAPGALANANFLALVELEVFTFYPNLTTGLLEEQGGSVLSQEVPVLNAWRRSDEVASMAAYDATQANPDLCKFLTRKPSRSIVTLGDSEYLGLYTKLMFSYRVLAFQWDGTQQDGQLASGATVFGADEATVLGVGPANINAVDPADWLPNTGPVVIDENTRYYIIQAGWHCPDGNYLNISEVRRYYVVPDSCQKHRVHFINSFGMPDSFSIFNNEQIQYLTESEDYTRPLPAGFGVVDEALARVQSAGRLQVSSAVGNITNEQRMWLAREFSMSTMVRLEVDGQYTPVVLKDGNFDVVNTDRPLETIKFTLEYSQEELSQRR